jgi:hypothetical protein
MGTVHRIVPGANVADSTVTVIWALKLWYVAVTVTVPALFAVKEAVPCANDAIDELLLLQLAFGTSVPVLSVAVKFFVSPISIERFVGVIVRDVIAPGGRITVNGGPATVLLFVARLITPVVAAWGTVAVTEELVQFVTVPAVPLNRTVPLVPKFDPEIVTELPAAPEAGAIVAIPGTIAICALLVAIDPAITLTLTFPTETLGICTRRVLGLQLRIWAGLPPIWTLPPFWASPKSDPEMKRDCPTWAEARESELSVGMTVNGNELLGAPASSTDTVPKPGAAVPGTEATITVSLHPVTSADDPLNTTVPDKLDCVSPKFDPEIVIDVPTPPEFVEMPLTVAVDPDVKATPELDTELLTTTTFPDVAPCGTTARTFCSVQFVVTDGIPLKVTLPAVPKFDPVIPTLPPAGATAGLIALMFGVIEISDDALAPSWATIVMFNIPEPALGGMLAVIELAVHELIVAWTLPKTIVPGTEPKLEPLTVTNVPAIPDRGETVVIVGETQTAKLIALLVTPPTRTTMLPVVAPLGTNTTMLVALQLITVARTPLNVTVLDPSIAPKPEPAIVSSDPTGPELADKAAMLGAGATTVTAVEPQIEPVHALTVAEPNASPKPTPWLLESLETVAMTVLEELHVTEANVCVLLLLNVPMATKLWAVPAGIDGLSGLKEIDTRFAGANVGGWYNSDVLSARRLLELSLKPPATRTNPFLSSVAVCTCRAMFKPPVWENFPAIGS